MLQDERLRREAEELASIQAARHREQSQSTQNSRESHHIDLTIDSPEPEPQPPQPTSLPQKPLIPYPNQSNPLSSTPSGQQHQDLGGHQNSNLHSQSRISIPVNHYRSAGPGPSRVAGVGKPKEFVPRNALADPPIQSRPNLSSTNSSLILKSKLHTHAAPPSSIPKGPQAWTTPQQPRPEQRPQRPLKPADQYAQLYDQRTSNSQPRQSLPAQSQSFHEQQRPDNTRRRSSSHSQPSHYDRERRNDSRNPSRANDDRNENDYSYEPERGQTGGYVLDPAAQAVAERVLEKLKQTEKVDPLASSTSSNAHSPYFSLDKQERDSKLQQSQPQFTSRSRLPPYPEQSPPSHAASYSHPPASQSLARSNSRDQNYPSSDQHKRFEPSPPPPSTAPRFDPNQPSLWEPDDPYGHQDQDMAPTLITPQDPSTRFPPFSNQASTSRGGGGYGRNTRNGRTQKFQTAGGGGKVRPDFDADEDEEEESTHQASSSNGKGKGKQVGGNGNGGRNPTFPFKNAMSAATAPTNTAHKGKGGSQSQASAVKQMAPISKKVPPKRSIPRTIRQDDEPTPEEEAARLVEEDLRKRAKESGRPHRVGDDQPLISIKGKGKAKAKEPEVMELSSDDDEEEEEGSKSQSKGKGRERALSGEISSPGGSGEEGEEDEMRMTGTFPQSRKPVPPKKNHQHLQTIQHDDPSSDDPLRIQASNTMRKGASASGSGSGGGNVAVLVDRFGGGVKGKQKAPVASSLAPRGGSNPRNQPIPNIDGAGNDGTDDPPPTTTSIKGASSKSKKKKGKSPDLEPVIDLSIGPYMLKRTAIPSDYLNDRHHLKLSTHRVGKQQKITITRRSGGGIEDDVVEFKLEDVQSIEWMIHQEDSCKVGFSIKLVRDKAEKILRALAAGSIPFEDLEGGSYGEFYVISKEQITNTETWKDDPSTPLEKMLFALNKYKPRNDSCLTLISQQRISPFEGSYARALTLAKDRASRTKPENRGKSNPKPSKDKTNTLQLALAFNPAKSNAISQQNFYSHPNDPDRRPPLSKDKDGDWVQDTSQRNDTLETQPRRSSRQPKASEKAAINRPPAEKDPYPTDHVVLEYPIGEPGAVTVTWGDKKRLNDEEFLNDTLIEFGLKKAIVDVKKKDEDRPAPEKVAPVVHVFNSFFYKKLSSGKNTKEAESRGEYAPHALVRKWTKKFNLFDRKYIIVPINEHLHWYLAVIVNPRWIIDAVDQYPPSFADPTERAPVTRGRTSTATTNENSVTLSSSSQPGSPAAPNNASAAEIKSRHFAGKKKNEDGDTPSNAGEEDDAEMEIDEGDEKSEQQIQAKIQEVIAKTVMGGEEEERREQDELEEDGDEGDATMIDATVEGGGPSNGHEDTLILSDEEEEQVVPASIEQKVSSTTTTAQGSAPTRNAVPIGAPTAPPKGASSPPKQPSPALNEGMEVDEELSAIDLARQLGADESAADRCWIFTFDSLGGKHDVVVKKLKLYLNEEAKEKQHKTWTAAEHVQGITVKVPQQPNFCDCGLYILHFVEQFLSDPAEMTRYIVAREHSKKNFPGQGTEANRKRAARKEQLRQLDAAMIKEDAWKEAVALAKRRTMRAEVEGLMEEYLPIKKAKDVKEAEEKKQREKKREERDAREAAAAAGGAGGDTKKERDEQEKRVVAEQQAAAKLANKGRGGVRGKKGKPEVIELDDSDDGDEDALMNGGSPQKSQPLPRPVDAVPSPAKPSSSSQQQQRPTSSDFLPMPLPATTTATESPARPSYSQQQALLSPSKSKSNPITTSLATPGLVDYESSSEDEGDVGNTQEDQEAEMARVRGRDRDQDPLHTHSEDESPPPKKKKKQNHPSPPPHPLPTQQEHRPRSPTSDQPDSSIEIRSAVTPELAAPPANQQQQQQVAEDKAPSSSGKTKSRRTSSRHKGTGEGDKEVETLELD